MDLARWMLAVDVGIGVIWFCAMLILAQVEHESLSLKEGLIYVLAWPFVLVVLRLWWAAIIAAVIIGLATFLALALTTARQRARS